MADTLVERVTGRPADVPVPVAVELVITDETLLGGDTTPARVPGYGPIPAAIACRLAVESAGDERSKATLRRLYRHPVSGALVAMESRARFFPAGLAHYIAVRDDTCRTPYCDAPIRHTDHARSHTTGGETTEMNGLGECAACNYAKEAQGWRVATRRERDGTHTSEVTTPPEHVTAPRHHHYPAGCARAPASSRSPSPTPWPGATPPEFRPPVGRSSAESELRSSSA